MTLSEQIETKKRELTEAWQEYLDADTAARQLWTYREQVYKLLDDAANSAQTLALITVADYTHDKGRADVLEKGKRFDEVSRELAELQVKAGE